MNNHEVHGAIAVVVFHGVFMPFNPRVVIRIHSNINRTSLGTAEACRGYTFLCFIDHSNGGELSILCVNSMERIKDLIIN